MLLNVLRTITILLVSFYVNDTQALPTIELQNVNLSQALRLITQRLHMNVVISPAIQNTETFDIAKEEPQFILNKLLTAYNLVKWKKENVWIIAPKTELIKLKQDELKLREMNEESDVLHTQVWQIQYAKAQDIAALIHDQSGSLLSKRGQVRADNRSNKIYIHDVLARIETIRNVVNRLDIPIQQIAIEARLVSIDNDFERELGVHFSSRQASENNLDRNAYPLAVIKLADHSFLDVKLAALENAGHAQLISSPSLFANHQQPATIEAGEEIPYQESNENGATSIAFKKAVLGLKVTPQVLPRNNILLQLQINQDRPSNKMIQGMPAISTRQIVTNVLVKSGQTCVLGGIYETSQEQGSLGLPFLNRIPVLGWLFQQRNIRRNKRELLVFITPRVIKFT